MKRLGMATLLVSTLWFGCADPYYHDRDDDRYAREHHRNSCEAPAVGVCAGCDVACRGDDQPSCTPGRSVAAQGREPGYCSEQASCRCLD
jgi:hypothetical protein